MGEGNAERERLLDRLLMRWQRHRRSGREIPAPRLCARCPELLPELERLIGELKRLCGGLDHVGAPLLAASHWPARTKETAPTKVAQYEVLEEVGRGGMGVVYKAHDPKLARAVAIKLIRKDAYAGTNARARFRREAEAAARVRHPHVVQVHAYGQHGKKPYLVLEFVDGGSLEAKVRGRPFAARVAAKVGRDLARAVAHAHDQGVIHRDLKPGNVLLTGDGVPKVTDFGLARVEKKAGDRPDLTAPEDRLGSPIYMAPEQASGRSREADERTDVYGLGTILFEMLTGRPPFEAEDRVRAFELVVNQEPFFSSPERRSIPADVRAICLKCLEKAPPQRYPSASDLAQDLERFLDDRPTQARPASPLERAAKWVRRSPTLAGLLAAGVLLAVLVPTLSAYGLFQRAIAAEERAGRETEKSKASAEETKAANERAAREAQEAQAARREGEHQKELAGEAGRRVKEVTEARDVALQREREARRAQADSLIHLVQATLREGRYADALRRLHEVPAEERRWEWHWLLRLTEGGVAKVQEPLTKVFARSADGRRVAIGSSLGGVVVREITTGRELARWRSDGHKGGIHGIAYHPTKNWIATAGLNRPKGGWNDPEVRLWDAQVGELLRRFPGHKGTVIPVFSPQGDLLATAGGSDPIRLWDTNTGAMVRDFGRGSEATRLAFHPDGLSLVSAEHAEGTGRLGLCVWDVKTGHEARRVSCLEPNTWAAQVDFSADGKRIAALEAGVIRLWEWPSWRQLRTFQSPKKVITGFGLSRDGTRVAVCDCETSGVEGKVWVLDAASGRVLVAHAQADGAWRVVFSPDDTRLLTSGADGVTVWEAESESPSKVLKAHDKETVAIGFDGSGSRVVSVGQDGARCWDRSAWQPTHRLPFEDTVAGSVALSQDGTKIALASSFLDSPRVDVWDVASGKKKTSLLLHAGTELGTPVFCFHPDNKRIACTVQNLVASPFGPAPKRSGPEGSGTSDLPVVVWDLDTGQPVPGPRIVSRDIHRMGYSPDGKHLVTAHGDGAVRRWDAASTSLVDVLLQEGQQGYPVHIGYARDGSRLVVGHRDSTRVWTLNQEQQKPQVSVIPNGTSSHVSGLIAVNSDGTRIARVFAQYDGGPSTGYGYHWGIEIWNVDSGQSLMRIPVGLDRVSAIALSPDDETLVIGCANGTLQVYDVRPVRNP